MGVVGARINNPKVQYHPYAADELILTAPAGTSCKQEILPEEIKQLPLIQREKGSGTRKSYEALLATHNIHAKDLNICATLGSTTAVKEAVKAELGFAFISRRAIADELSRGSLQEITITNSPMVRNFYIVTPKRRTLPHPYQRFTRHLKDSNDLILLEKK